ncbi:hypothetical protein GQR58_019049 [Nymphon striatum]|nr:hypothetical protein GQR58_019049 [Nymphon striatum]
MIQGRRVKVLPMKRKEEKDNAMDIENAELRSKVFEALGPAVDDGNEEEGEETYLNDDDMFKLDNALAEAFRGMNKPKNRKFSEKDESLMNFKLRCLDLLNILIQVKPSSNLIIKMILPMISALKVAVKYPKFQKHLLDKTVSCIDHLCKLKKFSNEIVEDSMLVDLLTTLVKKTSYVTAPQINKVLTNCCIFVMFCQKKPESDCTKKKKKLLDVPWYMPVIEVSLEKFFVEKNCHLQSDLFRGVMARNQAAGWIFHELVVKHVFNEKVRLYKRTEGLNLLSQIIRCGEKPINESSPEDDCTTQIKEKEWKQLCNVVQINLLKNLKESHNPELKPRHVGALLRVLYAILDVNSKLFKHDIFQNDTDEIVEELVSLPLRKLEKEARKCVNRSVHMLSGKAIAEVRVCKRKNSITEENEESDSDSKKNKMDVNNN